jgi:hypothetical protein
MTTKQVTAEDFIDAIQMDEVHGFVKTMVAFNALLSKARQEASDSAYRERNQVVAALAKCFPSVVTKTDIPGWDPAWHNCVYVTLPTGQASWHFHDNDAHLFRDIPRGEMKWDGHTTPEKYERLDKLKIGEARKEAVEEYKAVLRQKLSGLQDDAGNDISNYYLE